MKFVVALVAVLFVAGQISAQGMQLPSECIKNVEALLSLLRTATTLAKQWDINGLYATTTTGEYIVEAQRRLCKGKESEIELYLRMKYTPEERSCFDSVYDGLSSVIGKDQTHDVEGAMNRLNGVKTYFKEAFNCASVLSWTG